MTDNDISNILSEWTNEVEAALLGSKSLCVALFLTSKELIYANNSMSVLFKSEPAASFINPTFDDLLSLDYTIPLIFEGFLTLGDYSSIDASIWVQIFRKENKLLVIGGVNAALLLEQNESMLYLNLSVNNIQRKLLREKDALENALRQLNEANNELKKLNIDKDRFLSILSHDLKSPISSLVSLVSYLEENFQQFDVFEIENQVKLINGSAKSSYNLLEDILLWARTQRGKVAFRPLKLNFADICRNVIESLYPNASAKNITINYTDAGPITVFADSDMLKTILRNLVSNAVKFTDTGGKVIINAERTDSVITISVSDNGIGIGPDNLARLFDMTQIKTTKGTAKEKGTGLGLLLCKEFIEKQGGKIWVESKKDAGSVFYFTLPCDELT